MGVIPSYISRIGGFKYGKDQSYVYAMRRKYHFG